jgi:hypothetical protein
MPRFTFADRLTGPMTDGTARISAFQYYLGRDTSLST